MAHTTRHAPRLAHQLPNRTLTNGYWYHFGMAMTLRLPDELEKELDAIAAEEGVSKHSLITESARDLVERRRQRTVIWGAVKHVDAKYGDVIDRLSRT